MRMPLGLRVRQTAGRFLPFLRLPPTPRKDQVFHFRPVRNGAVEWETNEEGEAVLRVPRRDDRKGKVVGFLLHIPQTRSVQLDEVGTFVWNLCDGSNTVEGIVQKLARQFKMNRREVEVSVTTYLQMLSERNFIAFYQREGKRK
jgi:hypothetical protein